MSPLAQLLVDTVKNAGGKLEYAKVKEQVPPQDWRRIPVAFKEAQAEGELAQEVVWDGTANTHNYFVPVSEA